MRLEPAALQQPESLGLLAVIALESSAAGDTRLVGLSVAGRIVQQLAAAGIPEIWIASPWRALDAATLDDIARLAPHASVRVMDHASVSRSLEGRDPQRVLVTNAEQMLPADAIRRFLTGHAKVLAHGERPVLWRPAQAANFAVPDLSGDRVEAGNGIIEVGPGASQALLRTAGKPQDGVISRWINRPISRQITGLALRIPGAEPIHATLGTAIIAALMFAAFLTGTHRGLIVGALLFQFASIFDGVDGEMARLTSRTSARGAALDSTIDMITNVVFLIGVTFNLFWHGSNTALYLGLWSLGALLLGLWLIGRRTVKMGQPLGFDLLKGGLDKGEASPTARAIVAFFTAVTSRDCFAFAFALMIVTGFAMLGLYLFVVFSTIWLTYVSVSLIAPASKRELQR